MKILSPDISFPHPSETHESGILAIGGDLSVERLMLAYRYGIFPWYAQDEPILWWHPDPRFVLFPDKVKVAKSMRTYFNNEKYSVTFDTAYQEVLYQCKNVDRVDQESTWITSDIAVAYTRLYEQGVGHSVEVWDEDGALVGGLYGISYGRVFYGESMFSKKVNASKVALITLARVLDQKGFNLIDCQIKNPHLISMGGEEIGRDLFLDLLRQNNKEETIYGKWTHFMDGIKLKDLL